MAQSTDSDFEKLEIFFGAKFEIAGIEPNEFFELTCFDGFVYWRLWFDAKKHWLQIAADQDALIGAFPILEVGIAYSKLRVEPLPAIGTTMTLQPDGGEESENPFTLTRTIEGRITLCTVVGKSPFY